MALFIRLLITCIIRPLSACTKSLSVVRLVFKVIFDSLVMCLLKSLAIFLINSFRSNCDILRFDEVIDEKLPTVIKMCAVTKDA
jgi:hypothetical protein